MNRIREKDGKSQVLVTPHNRFDNSFELILGNWSDQYLKNYSVVIFEDSEKAFEFSYTMPDLNWNKLILFNKDNFQQLYKIIQHHIIINEFNVEFVAKMQTPEELKNTMFERIILKGERFRLQNDLNDIFAFFIINPWTSNLIELANIIKLDQSLGIFKLVREYGITRLIGKTSNYTTYEIVLVPTIIYNWMKKGEKTKNSLLIVDKLQKTIDNTIVIR
jgi:hypothetical protein